MNKLLAIEWMKIRRYRTFWILCGLFAVFLPLWNYGISKGTMKVGSEGNIDILSNTYKFSHVWQNLGFWASIFVVFISVLVIILVTNEFVYKTNRQNVIDGLSKQEFYHAKWLLILILAIGTTLFVFLLGLGLAATSDSFSNFPGNIEHLFYLFLLCVNYYGFALLLGLLFKRSGIAIGIFFMYYLIIENLAEKILNRYLPDSGDYLPLQASDELLPLPLMDMVKSIAQMNDVPPVNNFMLASLAWIIIYYVIGRLRIVKSDW